MFANFTVDREAVVFKELLNPSYKSYVKMYELKCFKGFKIKYFLLNLWP